MFLIFNLNFINEFLFDVTSKHAGNSKQSFNELSELNLNKRVSRVDDSESKDKIEYINIIFTPVNITRTFEYFSEIISPYFFPNSFWDILFRFLNDGGY